MTINEWIEKGCDYNSGVEIFAKLSTNKSLVTFFRGDPRFAERRGKLYHYLMKLKPKEGEVVAVKLPPKEVPKVVSSVTIEKKDANPPIDWHGESPLMGSIGGVAVFKDGTVSLIDSKEEGLEDNTGSSYPPVIHSAINLLSSLYKEKAKLWNEREQLGYENTPDVVLKRKKLSDMIVDITNRMDPLYKIRTDYFSSGIVPEDIKPSTMVVEDKEELPNNIEDLKALKKGVQTNIAKDRNRLEYQSPNKQKVKAQMPEGPKRTVVEERIKERMELVKKIDDKLKSMNVT